MTGHADRQPGSERERDAPASPPERVRHVERWRGEPGSVGTVAVIGMGKIGLPLAAQYAEAGWHVVGVDVVDDLVRQLDRGVVHLADEPGLAERIAAAHAEGRFAATTSHRDAAARADVVVVIVPVMLSDGHRPDYRTIDAATRAIATGLHAGSLVIYETTLPVGDTRRRFAPMLTEAAGLRLGDPESGLLVAFSPERVYSGRVFRDLATYPKLVGGVDEVSGRLAEAFYRSVLTADIRLLSSSEAAEFAKIAETTYRDVNIALANEFASFAEGAGVDIFEVIAAANTQPFSHIHQPGIGVGGHCIPVYPHFMLSRAPGLELVAAARRINDAQVDRAVGRLDEALGGLRDEGVLVLGLTYRAGVKELAYSRGVVLVERLRTEGARVSAYDPLLSEDEVASIGASAWRWGTPADARALVTQTADGSWGRLDPRWFGRVEVVYDGRRAMDDVVFPGHVRRLSVGRGDDTVPERSSGPGRT